MQFSCLVSDPGKKIFEGFLMLPIFEFHYYLYSSFNFFQIICAFRIIFLY